MCQISLSAVFTITYDSTVCSYFVSLPLPNATQFFSNSDYFLSGLLTDFQKDNTYQSWWKTFLYEKQNINAPSKKNESLLIRKIRRFLREQKCNSAAADEFANSRRVRKNCRLRE